MSIADKLKSYVYNRLAKELSTGASGGDPFAIWSRSGSKKISAARAMAQYKNWVYAATKSIADEIAATELRIFKINSDNTSEELQEHEALDLLAAPNPFMTGAKLRFLTATHLELTGNAYWHLLDVKSATSKPSGINILMPKDVEIIRGDYPELIKGYKFRDDNQKTHILQPFEVLHFDYPDPNNPIEGIGTVQAIWDWLESDELAQEFNKKFFENGARLSGLIEHPSAFNKDQLEFIKKSFEQIYSGIQNAYRTAVLPTGAKFQQVSATPKEMDFQEGGKNNRDKILGGFRTPKTAIGLTEDVNRANAEATDYVFASRNIKPKRDIFVSVLNEFFIPRYGDRLWIDHKNTIPEDKEAKVKEMQAATGNQPIMSPNEARERFFSLGPIEGGDAVRGALMNSPIGEPIKSSGPMKVKINGRAAISRFAKNQKNRSKIGKEIADMLAKEIKGFETNHKAMIIKARKDITTLNDDDYEILHKAFVNRVDPYEKKLRGGVEDLNAAIKKEVDSNLSSLLKSVKAVDPNDLFDQEKAVSSMTDLATPVLTDLYIAEAVAAAGLIGIEGYTPVDSIVKAAIERAVGLLSASYTDSMRTLLKEKLTETMAEGPDLDKLKNKVTEIFDFQNEVRSEQVARTETFRIGNEATVRAWADSGIVESKKWYTASDERVCDHCGPMHGKTIAVEDDFFKKGDTTDTGLDVSYDNVEFPPLHVTCRCYVRPEGISVDGKAVKKEQPTPEPEPEPIPEPERDIDAEIEEKASAIAAERVEKIKGDIVAEATEKVAGIIQSQIENE